MKPFLAIIAAVLLPWQSRAQDISPCVDAIEQVSPGIYRYWFGYRSTFSTNVTLATTVHNGVSRTDTFKPGRHFAVFSAPEGATWIIGERSATAGFDGFYTTFQASARPSFLLAEKPFAAGGVLWFTPRTVTQNGVTTYEFRWWRRDPGTGSMQNDIAWDSDWLTTPRPGSVTQVLVLTTADKTAALARLGLTSNTQNDQRALVSEALLRIDKLSPP